MGMNTLFLAATAVNAVTLRNSHSQDPTATPLVRTLNQTALRTTNIMCHTPGGNGGLEPWCTNWVECVTDKVSCPVSASIDEDNCWQEVKAAWAPPPCTQWCSFWKEGSNTTSEGNTSSPYSTVKALDTALTGKGYEDCVERCDTSQASLAKCVSTLNWYKAEVAQLLEEMPVVFNEVTGSCYEQIWSFHSATNPKAVTASHFSDSTGCPTWQ